MTTQGPSGPLSGQQGPSGPLSGQQGPSGPLSGQQGGPPVRLLLFQAAGLRRAALHAAFQSQHGIEIVAAVSDDEEVMGETRRLRVDVALMDADLGRSRVVAVCRALKASGPVRVLVLDDGGDEAFVLALVEAGADGYIDRTTSLSQLVLVVRRLHAGELWIPPDLLRATLQRLIVRARESGQQSTRLPGLSRRQREVAGLLAEGMSNLAIAERLAISPHTVRTHVQKVLEKLDAHSRLEAATIALDLGRVEPSHAV